MSELYREQRPLLSDELSNDEFMTQNTSLQFHRRMRTSAYSGRAKIKAKGAISVLTRWPDHLSSLLAYWWAGFGMIAVTIFIIYNSMSIIDKVSPVSALPVISKENLIKNITRADPPLLNVFMHIFVKEHEDISTDVYVPYIKVLSKKHSNFNYNIIVVVNDVTDAMDKKNSAENNNEMAWNSLWSERIEHKKNSIDNISIQFISLTNYLDKSPLRKYWREIPKHFTEFLVKCVAIWEKGGIAFNPVILTPESPNSIYLEKLQNILKKYTKHFNNKYKYNEHRKQNKPKTILKVNNIRDIINNLENQDDDKNISILHLEEAENREVQNFDKVINGSISKRSDEAPVIEIKTQNTKTERPKKYNKNPKEGIIMDINYNNSKKSEINDPKTNIDHVKNDNSSNTANILPKFLKYLFHGKLDKSQNEPNTPKLQINETQNKSHLETNSRIEQKIYNFNVPTANEPSTLTIIDNQKENFEYYTPPTTVTSLDENTELTIDLSGNFIAAKTPCHAFIGTVFSNIARHSDKDTITDLIIAELSLFCKGLLSSCHGVDVIL